MSRTPAIKKNVTMWCFSEQPLGITPIYCDKVTKRGVYHGGRRYDRRGRFGMYFETREEAVQYGLDRLNFMVSESVRVLDIHRQRLSDFLGSIYQAERV